MIRKAVIGVSAALALATFVVIVTSFFTRVWWDSTLTEGRLHMAEIDDGYLRGNSSAICNA